MVRERKTHVKDIEKLHDLIDSASLPKQKIVTIHNTAQLEELRKRLSEESFTGQKPPLVVPQRYAASEELKPHVIVHKKIEPQKKIDKKVIQIDLEPQPKQPIKKQPIVNYSPLREDPFATEPLYEIEKTIIRKKTPGGAKPKTVEKTTKAHKEFIPVSPPKKEEEHLPEFQPVPEEPTFTQPPQKTKRTLTKKESLMGEPLKEEQKGFLSVPHRQNEMPSFEPVDFIPTAPTPEKKEPMRFEMPQKAPMSRKQKRIEEKKAKQEAKEKEKKLKIETKESEQKHRQEQKQKELELKEAFIRADEQEREEQRLQKEQEKKSRLEIIERQKKEKEDRKQKKVEEKKARFEIKEKNQEANEKEKKLKIEARETEQKHRLEEKQKQINEKKARLELKEKKREAKRLAKEHDRKLKLEWIEFQHKQRQSQKQKDFEQKKAAVESKEKEQEEQRLLKEREQKLRFEQAAIAKKEKEDRKQKKIDVKKARQEAKIKERENRRLAKEKEEQLKKETFDIKQKQQEEQKEIEKKRLTAQSEEKLREEQLLKEMEEKSQLELLERQKKEKEKQKSSKIKKEKKSSIAPQPEPQKKVDVPPIVPSLSKEKSQKPKKKFFGGKKEERVKSPIWESYEEKPEKEPDSRPSIPTEQAPEIDTQKKLMKERKREQKHLAKEQKEKANQRRLEAKKKEKEQKMQAKIEEKQRRSLFGSSKGTKQIWEQNTSNEKLPKKEAKAKEREAQRLLKEGQKRKDRNFALKEIEAREKEKEEQKQKQITEKKDKEHISRLSFGKAKTTGIIDERKQAEQQRQTMDLVRIAAEEKELRKTKVFERKMQKEQKKREKEEQKYKAKAEEKAKKNLDIHMKEEIMKEKMTNQVIERTDPFVAFDSIDPEIAGILNSSGYTTIEQLRQATVKDLTKSGIKKKIAQRIIAECAEFVEWQVFDSIEHF